MAQPVVPNKAHPLEQEWWLLKQWHRFKKRYYRWTTNWMDREEWVEFHCGYKINLEGRMHNIQPVVPEWGRNNIHIECEEEDDDG